jgi:8-oxo-dGTP pyrophosphatase MutT (NUDIX family)
LQYVEETTASGNRRGAPSRREVAEETGLRIEPGPITGIYKHMTRGIVALVFRCESGDEEPATTEEVVETRWMTATEISEILDPAYACRLLDALDPSNPPAVRTHDGERLLDE